MNRQTFLRAWGLIMVVALVITMLGAPVAAQAPDGVTIESETAAVDAPVMEEAVWTDTLPELTEDQIAQLEWGVDNTHLAPPVDTEGAVGAAAPEGSEAVEGQARDRSGQPLAPGDAIVYKWQQFGGAIPAGYKSNVMESSISGGKAKRLFYTGNWFAAQSTNKGSSWTYMSPYTGFTDFCCDQVVIHDPARDIYLWLRMGSPYTDGGGNYENQFKLSVDFRQPFVGSYWTYTFEPMSVNASWTNQWWDYPHMQLGADFLYISWNMFDQAGYWTRTVMLRFPLDELAAAAGFGFNYYAQSDYFVFVPVSGAYHTMYFASNWGTTPYDHLRIWRWDEDSAGLTVYDRTITAWTATGRGDAHCGTPNWTARLDMRLLTGARYSIYNTDVKYPGRKVLAWWWTVGEGGGFPYPYIEGAAFFEDTITQVSGTQGRPLIWNSTTCFAYPTMTANVRQDLGAVFNSASSPDYHKPKVSWALADDYTTAPGGWTYYNTAASSAGPSDTKWGDYNTVRAYQSGEAFLGAAHYIGEASNCSTCGTPLFFAFGRERDYWGGFKAW